MECVYCSGEVVFKDKSELYYCDSCRKEVDPSEIITELDFSPESYYLYEDDIDDLDDYW